MEKESGIKSLDSKFLKIAEILGGNMEMSDEEIIYGVNRATSLALEIQGNSEPSLEREITTHKRVRYVLMKGLERLSAYDLEGRVTLEVARGYIDGINAHNMEIIRLQGVSSRNNVVFEADNQE